MVEWKKLGEVTNLVRGKVISKDYIRDNEGVYPVYFETASLVSR